MKGSLIPRPNFIVALLSTVALFVVSALAAVLITLEKPIAALIHAQIFQIVELHEGSDDMKSKLMATLKADRHVDTTSIQWMTGAEAARFMKEETGLDFVIDGEDPFSDLITFRVNRDHVPNLEELELKLKPQKGVKEVFFQHQYFKQVSNSLHHWRTIAIWIAGLLLLVAFTILSGLFRLILYAERMKIKTMELVGASNWYVMRPYVGRFIMIGVVSILIASGLFWLIWQYYLHELDLDWAIFMDRSVWMTVLMVWLALFAGIVLISVYVLRSFLNKSLEELE